jgi:PadR family transcriptional regulator, regulatory protein PadR
LTAAPPTGIVCSIQTLEPDSGRSTMTDRLAVMKGTLDVLVLKALAWGTMHGFEIGAWLERRSDGNLALDDSGLYQALYRLEGRGLVAADWGVTENNRRARYYKLTAAGRAHLRRETATWMRYAGTVTRILTDAQPAT